MPAIRKIGKFLAAIVTLWLVAACDDDSGDKKPKYEVEIYVSDNIKWEIIEMKPEGRFKKPLVEVHHPEGVDTKHVERKPKKTTVIEFAPVVLPAMLVLLLALASRFQYLHLHPLNGRPLFHLITT